MIDRGFLGLAWGEVILQFWWISWKPGARTFQSNVWSQAAAGVVLSTAHQGAELCSESANEDVTQEGRTWSQWLTRAAASDLASVLKRSFSLVFSELIVFFFIDDHGNSNSSHVKIFLPKKLLECLPKCSSLPKERHRWNTNEVDNFLFSGVSFLEGQTS